MTLSTTVSRQQYLGAGSTGPFAYPFRVFAATDLLVTKRSAAIVETTLAYGVDFTVAGVGDATGSVTLTAALAVGETLVLRRVPPITQSVSVRNQGPFLAATHEDAFDRLVMQSQSLKDAVDRSFKLSESFDPADFNTQVAPRALELLGFNVDASALTTFPASTFGGTATAVLSGFANVKSAPYGALGNNLDDDSAKVQLALDALAGTGGTVYFPPGTYKLLSPLTIGSNTDIMLGLGATLQLGTRLDYMLTANGKSDIHIWGSGKIKGTNTSYAPAVTERLLYFVGCDKVSVKDVELSQSIIGCQFESSTKWRFNATVRDILHHTDLSEGYGVLADLNNFDFRISGEFYNIGRHPIYISAGSSQGVVTDVVIDGCDSVGIDINCFDTENVCNNISISNVAISNVGRGSALPKKNGITIFGNASNITLGEGIVIDTVDGDGISVEGTNTYAVNKNPRGINIGSPVISNTGGKGIFLTNLSSSHVGCPVIRTTAAAGIHINTTGVGTGAIVNGLVVESYVIDTPATYGIIVGEATPGDVAAGAVLGRGVIKNAGTNPFNFTALNLPVLNWPHVTFDYSELLLAASQVDNPFVANPAAAYWIAPEAGYLVGLIGRVTGSLTAGNLTVRASKNGVGSSFLQAALIAGSLDFEVRIPPGVGGLTVAKGDQVSVMYTTDAGFLPSGSRNCVAQLRFVRFP